MKYLSLCSGVEAASVAWHSLGFTPVGFAEIEPFPCWVLSQRFPKVKNYGDMTKFKTWKVEPFDLLVAGTPCFTAGHMVLSEKGYVPIETLKVGDSVITHEGRLQKVLTCTNLNH